MRARLGAPDSPFLMQCGWVMVVGGFALIAYTWGRVGGLLAVALQLPYLVSGGFTGLGLVVIGITCVAIGSKRRDAWQREQRLRKLSMTLEAIATALKAASTTSAQRELRTDDEG